MEFYKVLTTVVSNEENKLYENLLDDFDIKEIPT